MKIVRFWLEYEDPERGERFLRPATGEDLNMLISQMEAEARAIIEASEATFGDTAGPPGTESRADLEGSR
jgi:hypothetical protein